jgi:hypothetical protein
MLTNLKRIGAAGFTSAALFMGIAAPASAQPIVTGGLVNVTIVDVLNNNTVTVPVAVGLNLAANVCDVNVNVLAQQFHTGTATCTNGTQTVTISQPTG